jgi:hypothetical protein
MFAVFNLIIAIIVHLLFPETKGLSLEEIDFYFVRKYGTKDEVRDIDEYTSKQAYTGGERTVDGINNIIAAIGRFRLDTASAISSGCHILETAVG